MNKELKQKARYWLNCNVWDGEDRSGAIGDYASFTPDELCELFCDFIDSELSESELQSLRAENDELLDQLERFGVPCPPMPVKESNNE